MVPAVALKKRIPKPQLCQRLREDCSGRITDAIIVASPRTPSISRAVSSAVQLLSIVYLAFPSHHIIVLDFKTEDIEAQDLDPDTLFTISRLFQY